MRSSWKHWIEDFLYLKTGGVRMKGIIRFVKQIFGMYEPGIEYWVRLDEIRISNKFASHDIGKKKMKHKWRYYNATGKFESPILLDHDFVLCDGYSSYLIAKKLQIYKVAVQFVAPVIN